MNNKLLLLAFLAFSQIGLAQVSFTTVNLGTSGNDRAVVDMNGDFLDDVVSVNQSNVQIYYQLATGGFEEVNIATDFANYPASWSLAAADYDRNGFTDLLYGGGSGVTFMRANDDGTAFTEISGPEYVFSQRSNFVDINNDGHLDAFVCHDVAPNVYYINDGSGNLTFNQGGLGDYPSGGHYGSVWIDYDNDRDMDMFIAKCGGESDRRDNEMHRNNGDGTFTEVGADLNLEDDMQSWSSAWADFDNDGDMDIWIGASTLNSGFHRLMRNNNDGSFTDVIADSGLTGFMDTDIENATYDFDNDGNADIISSGNILYGNGDLTFTIASGPFNGSFGDLNNDGFIDVFRGGAVRMNDGNSNNWLKINTIGVDSNINGIGARVEIETASGTQMRDVRSGEGFGNMSSLNTHFGLGLDTEVLDITIYWPSGVIDTLEDVEANQTISVTEGETILSVEDSLSNELVIYPNPASNFINISTIEPLENPVYTVFDITGRRVMNGFLTSLTLDVSGLAEGQYVLRIKDRKKVITEKFDTKR